MPEIERDEAAAAEIIQLLAKAQKVHKMYPPNNPTCARALDGVVSCINAYTKANGDLVFKFSQNEIFSNDKAVYSSDTRHDNLALFFFRDGIREITFNPAMPREEAKDFLTIIARDFERQYLDDDIVTLLWERAFKHIHYVATDDFLLEEGYDPSVETVSAPPAVEIAQVGKMLNEVYEEAAKARKTHYQGTEIAILTEEENDELRRLVEVEETSSPLPKLISLLFGLLSSSEDIEDFEEVVDFISSTLRLCFRRADFENAELILARMTEMEGSEGFPKPLLPELRKISLAAAEPDIISEMGEILDSEAWIDEGAFVRCAAHLDTSAIPLLLDLLGGFDTIRARRIIMDVLGVLGRKNIAAITKGLHDSRWFVVRNTLHILGKINDPRSINTLGECVRHKDPRVRKEAYRALTPVRNPKALPYIRRGFLERDPSIRVIAAKAFLGFEESDVAMRIFMEEVQSKGFHGKDYSEKKEFFEVLSQWNRDEVKNYLLKTLRRKSLIARTRNDEIRACAAFAMGLMKENGGFAAPLEEAAGNGGKLLREMASEAISRMRSHAGER